MPTTDEAMPSMRMPPWRNAMASKERADVTGNGMIGSGNETGNRMTGKGGMPPWTNGLASKARVDNNRMAGNKMIGKRGHKLQ